MLDQVSRPAVTPYHLLPVAQMRHDAQKLHFAYRPAAPAVAECHFLEIPRPDGSVLPARYYRGAGTEPDEALPVLVYFHGGGWTVGDLASYDVLARELANGGRCAVVTVGYRLAPEHPFPAGVEDASHALDWVARQAGNLRLDDKRIAVGGDSAGGNLALVASLAARDAGRPALCFSLLVYPAVDQRGLTESHQKFGEGFMLTREVIARFQQGYLPDQSARENWRASPILAERFDGLPPALVMTAEFDPLTDDALACVARLREAGVAVEHHQFAGMIHGFFTLGGYFEDGARAVALAADRLRRAFEAVKSGFVGKGQV